MNLYKFNLASRFGKNQVQLGWDKEISAVTEEKAKSIYLNWLQQYSCLCNVENRILCEKIGSRL